MTITWRWMTDADRQVRNWKCDGPSPHGPWHPCNNRAVLIAENVNEKRRAVVRHTCADCEPDLSTVLEVLDS